eukprot:scaffold304_cov216-Alexandrium_tamarense.AAC.18
MSQNATKVLALYGGRFEVSIAHIREENLSKNMMRRRQEHFVGDDCLLGMGLTELLNCFRHHGRLQLEVSLAHHEYDDL